MESLARKVVVAGGRGMLGRSLCPRLAARGWEVVVLSRSPREAPREGVRFVVWDGKTVGEWCRELEGAAAVINLAGRSVNCRYTRANRRAIMDSRLESTRTLGEAIRQCAPSRGPTVWLNSSTATIYRHNFGPAWDEQGAIGATPEARDAFSIEVATAWERAFFESDVPGVRKVALRTAIVLSPQPENMVAILRRLARLRLGGAMGTGKQWVSWVHAEDFCRAVEFLMLREGIDGVVNVAAPNPVTNSEMMRMIRAACGVRIGLPAARWMLEAGAFVLRTETELILKSRRVVAGVLPRAGFDFRHPEMMGALRDLIEGAGRRTGTIPCPMPGSN